MDVEEARQYREAISLLPNKRELGWLIQQANEKITLGKTVSKRLQTT